MLWGFSAAQPPKPTLGREGGQKDLTKHSFGIGLDG